VTPRDVAEANNLTIPAHSGAGYHATLEQVHRHLKPETYFEIGVHEGHSLAKARCASVGVDPAFRITQDIYTGKPSLQMFQMTSDAFFDKHDLIAMLGRPVDLAFLDGLHLFEVLLRDFINLERACKQNSVIIMHDCIPTSTALI
jgi:hypothetical protein